MTRNCIYECVKLELFELIKDFTTMDPILGLKLRTGRAGSQM